MAATRSGLILGIESSCDETAAAVVRAGTELLSNVVFSQIAIHQPFGGVVPELASREHLRAIVPVVRRALADSCQTYQSVDALAVTQGPGLAGALLVGISYAKALAFALDKPLIAVNHLEGHIHAVLLEQRQNGNCELNFPVIALVVSGGHTHLYLAEQTDQTWSYENIGRTRDDAAGEAFDKVAKLLGLGYPGGPLIDKLSAFGNPIAVKFASPRLKHPDRNQKGPTADGPRFDFSYSGIKTAILRYVETHNLQGEIESRRDQMSRVERPTAEEYRAACPQSTLDLIASFQRTIVEDVVKKTIQAARYYEAGTLFVTGGVAANNELRSCFEREAGKEGIQVLFPSRSLSTDNAAMIAAAAYPKLMARNVASMDFCAEPSLILT